MNRELEPSVCSTGAFPARFQPNETRNMQIAPNAGKEKLPAGSAQGERRGFASAAPQPDWIAPFPELRVLLSAEAGKSPSAAAGKGSGHGESGAALP